MLRILFSGYLCAAVVLALSVHGPALACDDGDEDLPAGHVEPVVSLLSNDAIGVAAGPYDDNLGYKWMSTSTGPNVTLAQPKNANRIYRPNADGGIPLNLIADWNTLNPVMIFFSQADNPDPGAPGVVSHFFLNMQLTNKTGKTWKGFKISIIDQNELPYFDIRTMENGSLRHPNRVHLHTDSFNYDQLKFKTVTGHYSIQRTTNPATGDFVIENRTLDLSSAAELNDNTGQYALDLSGAEIANNATWTPTKFVYNADRPDQLDFNAGASVLDLHAKDHLNSDGVSDTAFVLVLQAIVPEPGTLSILAVAPVMLLRRRRGR